MWSVWLTLLLQAVAHELAELALVRPFASNQEIQEIESAFSLWNAVSPCGDKALAEVDIFLVYSRRLDENPVASIAAANVQNSFRHRSEPWHRCFREFHIEAANLTAAEDIYDSRGYAVRKDWVNGPNKVFCFILQSFLEKSFVSDYEAFFFMEFDSTPLRPFWLDQFYAEVFQYPRTAIRGSRYRGDSWDNFLHHIPNSLLYHMNGNAIYFLRHPWLRFLAQKLEEDATSENGSIAFDVRMAQLTLEAPTRSDLQTAWTQNVPEGENPYQDDSLLVGNYANTLLNDSFEPPEFVRHGALANILENLDNKLVTLAVQAFHQANATLLMESLSESDFGEVVVVSSVDFAPPGTWPLLRVVPATLPEHMALCDLAAAVHTDYFLFTDTYHFIPGPTHILVNGSHPVLPYIPASSVFCTAYPECTTSLDQAENFYGVKLNYHHNKYETLFRTLLAREFCQSWNLAAGALGSFDSCDYQHGPTADDYIAWLISMDKPFDYMPKNKERVGWRQWSVLWNAHPPDQRDCSIYTESDALKRKRSIKECSLYIQDGDACNADENCTFRAIFEAGKCMSTSEFHLLPATMDARTSTWTISTSSTASATPTLTSSTGSKTLTSSWTTLTATSMSTSTTRSTVDPGTSSTVFASSTRTQTTQLTISLPAFCKEDGLPIVGVDVSNCIGRFAGESCSVLCAGSFEGDPATFVCGNDGTFTGEIQCEESTCAVETLPDGFETDCEQTPPGGSCFVWIPFLAASCVLLVCCCSCVIRRQCRKNHAETRQALHSEDQRQNDGHLPAKDFGSELEKPRLMGDAGLVDAGIYLEEEGLDQDNEEVRLRLEDVGVFYEEGDCSESFSIQPEAGAASQARQESSASGSVLLPQPRSGQGVLRNETFTDSVAPTHVKHFSEKAKDFGSELEKPQSMGDAGLVDAGIYLEEEGINDEAISDAASEESDNDGLHL